MKDLGLSYEEALHGIQSAIKFEMEHQAVRGQLGVDFLKHLRVGIDARAADALGLAELLIAKGVFTRDEYIEHMRLAANAELDRYQEHCRAKYGLPANAIFR